MEKTVIQQGIEDIQKYIKAQDPVTSVDSAFVKGLQIAHKYLQSLLPK
jgi:hypothetical protein